jgi:hypothetical protein
MSEQEPISEEWYRCLRAGHLYHWGAYARSLTGWEGPVCLACLFDDQRRLETGAQPPGKTVMPDE